MADFDSAVLHRIYNWQDQEQSRRPQRLNLKLVVGGFPDCLAHKLGTAEDCIKRFRPADRHAPFDFRHRLRNRRRSNSACGKAQTRSFQKLTTLHSITLPWFIGGNSRMSPSIFFQTGGIATTMAEPTSLKSSVPCLEPKL